MEDETSGRGARIRQRGGVSFWVVFGGLATPLGLFGCSVEVSGAGAVASEKVQTEHGVRLHEPAAFEGYTLVAPYLATTTYVVDMQGEVVHQWESDATPAGAAYLLEDGSLLRCADTENDRFRSKGTGGRVQLFDWEGNLVWDYLVSDEERMQNHDFEPLPNGNVLVAAWDYRSREEAIATGFDPERASERGLWPCVLMEIRPVPPTGGEVVWEWNAWDHLVQDLDPSKDNYGDVGAHPELLNVNNRPLFERLSETEDPDRLAELQEEMRAMEEEMRALGYTGDEDDETEGDFDGGFGADFMHVNGVSYEPDLDLIVLSCWSLSEVLVIDHSTTTAEAAGHTGGRQGHGGDLLYRWGNPQNYGAGTDDDQQLFSQHDARWLPGPNLLVFNNDAGRGGRTGEEGGRRGRRYSTVDEIVLPFDRKRGFAREAGAPFGPAAPVWSYRAENPEDFYGSFISGAHRLPNGNTFICEGPKGRLFEVTPDRRTVWEYVIPFEAMTVDEWWGRFGWGDMEMDTGDMEDMEGIEDREDVEDDFMVSQAAFRATRIAPDHPGLRNLAR